MVQRGTAYWTYPLADPTEKLSRFVRPTAGSTPCRYHGDVKSCAGPSMKSCNRKISVWLKPEFIPDLSKTTTEPSHAFGSR